MSEKSEKFRNSSLSLRERIADLLSRLTVEEKIYMLSNKMRAVPRLGITEWNVGCEIARGYVTQKDMGRQDVSTVFPQPIGMASTFDPELMFKIGEIAGDEARFYYQKHKDGCLMVWGPTVDMARDPRWGRVEEAYGEDPFLAGEMTKAYTKALAGDDEFYMKTIPALKHFCCNNNEKDRGFCDANVDPRTLHEYYYRAFKPALTEGGARSVMAAYNELSGVPAIMNPDIQKLLKDEWGMWFAVADGGDFAQNLLMHKCVKTHAEALALCIKSGVDSMTDPAEMVAAAALYGLENNILTEQDIDKAVGNVLMGRFRLGEFDDNHSYKNMSFITDGEKGRAVNAEAALKQMCLLKNNGLLPLKKGVKIALIGGLANQNYRDWYTGLASYDITVRDGFCKEFGAENILFDNGYDIITLKSELNGKYLAVDENDDNIVKAISENPDKSAMFEYHEWGVNEVNYKSALNNLYVTEENGVYKAQSPLPYSWFIKEWFKPSFYDELVSFRSWRDRATDIYIDAERGFTLSTKPAYRQNPEKQFKQEFKSKGADRAAELAKKADVAIVCVGNHPMQVARECYDREDLELPKHQSELVKAAYEANPNTVLLIISSYPYAVNRENENLPAIIYTSHAGPELGTAVAKTVSGANNPAARCPLTWYKAANQLPDIMDYDIIANNSTYMYYDGEPLYPFGHGLSYSEFIYSDFEVIYNDNNGKITARVSVKNAGADGDEVVQFYFKPLKPRVKRPLRKLCGFKRVSLKAGQIAKISVDIPCNALEFYDVTREKLCVEAGEYEFSVGASCLDVRDTSVLYINGELIPPRDMSKDVKAKNFDRRDNVKLGFSRGFSDNGDWYAKTDEWGGFISFDGADLKNYEYAEIVACAPYKEACIEFFAESIETEPLGSVIIPPSPSPESFSRYKIPLEKYLGIAPLILKITGMASVYSVILTSD